MNKKILISLIWSVYIFLCVVFFRIFSADLNYKKSQVLLSGGYSERAHRLSQKSVNQNPLEPNYYRGRAKVNLIKILYVDDLTVRAEIKEKVLSDLKKATSLNENNLVTIRNLVPLYYYLAITDMNSESTLDSKYIDVTRGFLESNKNRFWNDAGVISSIAKYERKLGFVKEYGDSVRRIMELRPDLLDWYESFR